MGRGDGGGGGRGGLPAEAPFTSPFCPLVKPLVRPLVKVPPAAAASCLRLRFAFRESFRHSVWIRLCSIPADTCAAASVYGEYSEGLSIRPGCTSKVHLFNQYVPIDEPARWAHLFDHYVRACASRSGSLSDTRFGSGSAASPQPPAPLKYSIGPSTQLICTRCCFRVPDVLQFTHWSNHWSNRWSKCHPQQRRPACACASRSESP